MFTGFAVYYLFSVMRQSIHHVEVNDACISVTQKMRIMSHQLVLLFCGHQVAACNNICCWATADVAPNFGIDFLWKLGNLGDWMLFKLLLRLLFWWNIIVRWSILWSTHLILSNCISHTYYYYLLLYIHLLNFCTALWKIE